jgi:hypothetical protein
MSLAKRLLDIYEIVKTEQSKGRSISNIKAELRRTYPSDWVEYVLKKENIHKNIPITK